MDRTDKTVEPSDWGQRRVSQDPNFLQVDEVSSEVEPRVGVPVGTLSLRGFPCWGIAFTCADPIGVTVELLYTINGKVHVSRGTADILGLKAGDHITVLLPL